MANQIDWRAGLTAEIRRALRHLKRHEQGLPGEGIQRAKSILEVAEDRVAKSYPAPWPGAYFPLYESDNVEENPIQCRHSMTPNQLASMMIRAYGMLAREKTMSDVHRYNNSEFYIQVLGFIDKRISCSDKICPDCERPIMPIKNHEDNQEDEEYES